MSTEFLGKVAIVSGAVQALVPKRHDSFALGSVRGFI